MAIEGVSDSVLPIRVKWQRVIGVCRKCSRKLDNEGFGADGRQSLRKALRREGGKHVKAIDIKCLGICPKRGVCVIDGARPGQVLVAGRGAEVAQQILTLPQALPADPDA